MLAGAEPPKRQDTLQSFYIVSFFISDALGDSFDEILDVTPQGDDVRVRAIRISSWNAFCPTPLVRAAGRILRRTTVQEVAGRDLCSFTQEEITEAMQAARPKYVEDASDSASETVVAKCGSTTKVLRLPNPVELNWKALKRSNTDVSALWDTDYRIQTRAFGKHSPFYEPSPDQERQMRDSGTILVPELVSGKYDAAYHGDMCGYHKCEGYLAQELTAYTPPPNEDPLVVELLEASSLHLAKYVVPVLTPIARTARIEGDVRLKLATNQETGTVTSVDVVSGHPLLVGEAIKAAKSWQFAAGNVPKQPVEVTLRFELHCPTK